VEVADANLQTQPQFHDFLSCAGKVIGSYNFSDHTGLQLVHRHFDLEPDSVIVQQFGTYEGTPSLIASALPLADALAKGAVPSGWIFSGSSPQIFEFSTDEAVKANLRDIKSTPEFLEKMESILKSFHLERLLSVSLLKRESLVTQEKEVYQESTYNNVGSVVQVMNANNVKPAYIRTSWSFRGPKKTDCNAWCQGFCSEDQFGRHKGSIHWQNHDVTRNNSMVRIVDSSLVITEEAGTGKKP